MTQAAPIPSVPAKIFHDVIKSAAKSFAPSPLFPTEPDAGTQSVLEELSGVERLLITKRLRVRDVIFLQGKRNKFFVRTPDSDLVFTVEEENRWWVGYLCYGLRPLQLRVYNSVGQEVMTMDRPYACTTRVLPCQLQHLEVFSPPGTLIGSIEQQWAAIRPLYVIRNEEGEEILSIRGPYVTISLFRDIKFSMERPEGAVVGNTCKRWQGILHALLLAPITDRFGVTFDRCLKVKEKALLLAATLLMDYMYYDV